MKTYKTPSVKVVVINTVAIICQSSSTETLVSIGKCEERLLTMGGLRAFLLIVLLAAVCSCTGLRSGGRETQTFRFSSSSKSLSVSLVLELPTGRDSVTQIIRDSLVADFINNSQSPLSYDGMATMAPFAADRNDIQAQVDYYGKSCYDRLNAQAMEDSNARRRFLDEDKTLTPEEKERICNEAPQWEFNLEISKLTEALSFVVYRSTAYVYCGGAHGGVTGSGAMTFDKVTGRKIGRFVRRDAAGALQPLLREGLRGYFRECGEDLSEKELLERLFIEDGFIPLPADTSYPNPAGDSLTFVYRQYEIASYADGMPNFSLPVDALVPYLTPEGRGLLGVGDVENLPQGASFRSNPTAALLEKLASDMVYVESDSGSFFICKYEVTQRLWKEVMGDNPSKMQGDDLPVEQVNWNDCQAFISRLNELTEKNYRLPSESEWEYACRGGGLSMGYRFSGSDDIDEVAWYDGNSGGTIHPVGQKKPNELGLYDMSGNVWEWCQDMHDAIGMCRGGSWIHNARNCDPSLPNETPQSFSIDCLGLRLAL